MTKPKLSCILMDLARDNMRLQKDGGASMAITTEGWIDLSERAAVLEAETERLRVSDRRYGWLREHFVQIKGRYRFADGLRREALDGEIDEAIGEATE